MGRLRESLTAPVKTIAVARQRPKTDWHKIFSGKFSRSAKTDRNAVSSAACMTSAASKRAMSFRRLPLHQAFASGWIKEDMDSRY